MRNVWWRTSLTERGGEESWEYSHRQDQKGYKHLFQSIPTVYNWTEIPNNIVSLFNLSDKLSYQVMNMQNQIQMLGKFWCKGESLNSTELITFFSSVDKFEDNLLLQKYK